MQDPLADAADDPAAKASASVRPHDQQLGVKLCGQVDDIMRRLVTTGHVKSDCARPAGRSAARPSPV